MDWSAVVTHTWLRESALCQSPTAWGFIATLHDSVWQTIPLTIISSSKICFTGDELDDQIARIAEGALASQQDVYWCPTLFRDDRRIKSNALDCAVVWSDLDEATVPASLPQPSYLWRTSTGRHQAIWQLAETTNPAKIEQVNKALAYAIDADRSGWDITQMLRVPGTCNYKRDEPEDVVLIDGEPKTIYGFGYLAKSIGVQSSESVMLDPPDSEAEAGVLQVSAWARSFLDELMYTRSTSQEAALIYQGGDSHVDRSAALFSLAGIFITRYSILDPYKLAALLKNLHKWSAVGKSDLNKFAGRRDEYLQLYKLAEKAIVDSGHQADIDISISETDSSASVLAPEVVFNLPDSDVSALSFRTMLGQRPTEKQWLVDGWWGLGEQGIVAGHPKSYKSTLAIDMAVSVASGVAFLGEKPSVTGPALVIQEENIIDNLSLQLQSMACSKGLGPTASVDNATLHYSPAADLPLYVISQASVDLSSPQHQTLIETALDKFKPVLLILDPLYLMMGTLNENDASDIRPLLRWVSSLRNNYGCAIQLVHHYHKPKADAKVTRAGHLIRGSGAFHAWVECAWYISRKSDSEPIIKVEREFRYSLPSDPVEIEIVLDNQDAIYETKVWSSTSFLSREQELVIDVLKRYGDEMAYQSLESTCSTTHSMGASKVKRITNELIALSVAGENTSGRQKKIYLV